MSQKILRYGAIGLALVLAVVGTIGWYAGWFVPTQKAVEVAKPVVSLRPPDRIELGTPGTDETLRVHVYAINGREVRTDIYYSNGDFGRTILRPDGSMAEYRRENQEGKILLLQKFATDGKTVVHGEKHREDGTLLESIRSAIDGVITTTVYWYDGVKVFSVTRRFNDKTFETTYFRKSGSVSGRKTGPTPENEEFFDKSHNLQYSRTRAGNMLRITTYGANGKASFRQTFIEEKSVYGGTNKKMSLLEEFDTDGKTLVRKVKYEGSYNPTEVEVYKDGGTTIRKLRYDGTVESEEATDAFGSVTRRTFTSDDNERESVEYGRTWEPYFRDPVQSWGQQEQYEYYRNSDD